MIDLSTTLLALALAAFVVFARMITKPLEEVLNLARQIAEGDLSQKINLDQKDEIGQLVEGMNMICEKMGDSIGRVASSSRQLAEGASEQAASIEEISSSMEEMASMIKQNKDNAFQAVNLIKDAGQIAIRANQSMDGLSAQMHEISSASEETQKIVKTIDEVAFQTNLLALNAAVEAARAGEVGAGFAVVADEVRNLAIRSANAAKNTAELIENTVKKVKGGLTLANNTNEAFSQTTESVSKVNELLGEIAAASNEQAQGIEQLNTAVAHMDKVVQQNAANAEELASSAAMFKTGRDSAVNEHLTRHLTGSGLDKIIRYWHEFFSVVGDWRGSQTSDSFYGRFISCYYQGELKARRLF